MKIQGRDVDTFTASYIETALWASTDELTPDGGEPIDKNYTAEDLAPETLEMMIAECAAFLTEARALIQDDEPPLTCSRMERAGHDFWLTRNGHGAGFWDGDWPRHGDALTELAEKAGERNLYVGEDERIWSVQ